MRFAIWPSAVPKRDGLVGTDMKLAIAGKGGVGKTTLSATLARSLARAGERVLAIDADPNNCLGRALGFPEGVLDEVAPLSEMQEMLAERAGTSEGGGFFSLNPPVEDLLERFKVEHDGVSLLVMGRVDEPGAGCVCPESAVLKALLRHLVGLEDLSLVVDMEAGLEHLGRGTAQHVGALLIVVEPTAASARTATRIAGLAAHLRMRLPGVVLNKVASGEAEAMVEPLLGGLEVMGTLPYDAAVPASEVAPDSGAYTEAVDELRQRLLERLSGEAG
jgi:CO dehydrogenase maturation factor